MRFQRLAIFNPTSQEMTDDGRSNKIVKTTPTININHVTFVCLNKRQPSRNVTDV